MKIMNNGEVQKERTAADILNLVIPALGTITKIEIPDAGALVNFEWRNNDWQVAYASGAVLDVRKRSAGCWSKGLDTELMTLLFKATEKK